MGDPLTDLADAVRKRNLLPWAMQHVRGGDPDAAIREAWTRSNDVAAMIALRPEALGSTVTRVQSRKRRDWHCLERVRVRVFATVRMPGKTWDARVTFEWIVPEQDAVTVRGKKLACVAMRRGRPPQWDWLMECCR